MQIVHFNRRERKRTIGRAGRGFTIIELMMVIGIVGVIAAIASYGVARYLRHAKTAEAMRSLAAIENGNRNKFAIPTDVSNNGTGPLVQAFCGCAGAAVAAASSCNALPSVPLGWKTLAPASTWAVDPWVCLKFTLNEPQAYQYQYSGAGSSTAATFNAYAYGDLDGNGVQSVFALRGAGGLAGESVRTSLFIIAEDE